VIEMRTLHLLCIKPECSNKPLHLIKTKCLVCGKKITYGIIYGPFIILACEDCFIEKILPKLGDEAVLSRRFNFIPVSYGRN